MRCGELWAYGVGIGSEDESITCNYIHIYKWNKKAFLSLSSKLTAWASPNIKPEYRDYWDHKLTIEFTDEIIPYIKLILNSSGGFNLDKSEEAAKVIMGYNGRKKIE